MQTYIMKSLVRHMFVTSASFVFLHKMSCMAQGGCISLVCMVFKHHFSHYRLERLLGLQSLKHVLQKQPTLKCPKLSLRNRSQLSDLLLVSTEGEEISCHKCVLVAIGVVREFLVWAVVNLCSPAHVYSDVSCCHVMVGFIPTSLCIFFMQTTSGACYWWDGERYICVLSHI